METNVFPRPAVAGELRKYIEARLHVDDQANPERAARYQQLQLDLARTRALPTYVVVDPGDPAKAVSVFDGSLLNDTQALIDWLRAQAK